MVKATPWPLYPQERNQVLTVKEAGWSPGLVCTGAENLAATGIRSSDIPVQWGVAIPSTLSRPTDTGIDGHNIE
jgi:hypothetical protein